MGTPQTAPAIDEYVIAPPTGFRSASSHFSEKLIRLQDRRDLRVLGTLRGGEKLIGMTGDEVLALKAEVPGLVIERNIEYRLFGHPIFDRFEEIHLPFGGRTHQVRIRVPERPGGRGIPDVRIWLVQRTEGSHLIGYSGKTNQLGVCSLTVADLGRYESLSLEPMRDFWSRRVVNLCVVPEMEIELTPLPPCEPEILSWGHQFMGLNGTPTTGRHTALRIGIIDSGIDGSHRDLRSPSGGRTFPQGSGSDCAVDEDGHGTHIAGIVAAQVNNWGIQGFIPDAQVYSYRVFSGGRARTFDLLDAIDHAIQDGCDILNLSFGSPTFQVSIRQKVEEAYEAGVLCVAATGNDGGAVCFPAGYFGVAGVGAFGSFNSYAPDTIHTEAESIHRSADGLYFHASFSNAGDQVDFCAPGVAIRSTVPGGFAAWDGTSMACPHVVGAAGLALQKHLADAPRDANRVEEVMSLLRRHSRRLGFGTILEGSGCPIVSAFI